MLHAYRAARAAAVLSIAASAALAQDWPAYGGTPEGTRYSSLNQINRSTVKGLAVAWTYDTGEQGAIQTQPIIVRGVLYANTPRGRVVALDAATGKLIWSFDSKSGTRGSRAVTYWSDGKEKRILAGFGRYVYAIDAASGNSIPQFGKDGRIDLQQDLGRDPETQSVTLTSPGLIYKDLLIVGGRESEGLPASPGDVRAYDVRTGKLRWSFHTIPHPGEPGYETWPKDAWTYSGAANNWAGMSVDLKRGIVYVPTGSAAADFYGANRLGDNLYANCLLALNAETGERLWHFQAVRHDIWDRDFPSQPTLVTVKQNGRTIDAVAQTSKQGWLFLFDRTSGKPLFPVEFRKYPPSTLEGEVASETQLLPVRPAPFARQLLTEDMLSKRTPEVHQWALDQFRTFRSEGQFVPLSATQPTVVFPGFDGGAEWGGSAYDSRSGLLFVNANDLPWTGQMAEATPAASGRDLYRTHCATCHKDNLSGEPPQIPALTGVATRRKEADVAALVRQGSGRMPGFASLPAQSVTAIVRYVMTGQDQPAAGRGPREAALKYRFTGYKRFYDPDGYPAVVPPWGTLNAINLNTGEYAWKVPLGEYPELAAKGLKDTGSENYGGPIVTAGNLVFIGATNFDNKIRAFDKDTGKLLWEGMLPAPGNGTPGTYEVGGRQFVAISASGGRGTAKPNAAYVAFALPKK
jgi:quinoprotein glucose dehydrogenase